MEDNTTVFVSTDKEPNQSIHPRVQGGKQIYDKVDTCMKPKKETIQRKIKAIEEHLSRHPRDVLSQKHLTLLKEKL